MVGDRPKLCPADAIRSVVFFGLLYLYLWLVVQPQLIYSCGTITNFPVFYKGWPFLRECLSYPGGLLRYLCALLPQFFYYSWAGVLVITAQAWAISVGTDWLLGMLAVPGRRLLRFVPPLLVVATYARYSYHFPTITGALASLLFACLYIALTGGGGPGGRAAGATPLGPQARPGTYGFSIAVYVLLSLVLYVVGGAALLPFAALCVVYELLYRRGYGVAPVCLLLSAAIPYIVGVLVFHASIVNAYTDTLPISWQIGDWITRRKMIVAVYALYLFPIGIAVAWGLGRSVASWWSSRRAPAKAQPAQKKSRASVTGSSAWAKGDPKCEIMRLGTQAHPAYWMRRPAVRWTLESIFLLAVGGVVAFVSLDRSQKALLTVHYHACRHEWPQVLEASRRCPDNYTVMNAVNLALYHTGRLSQDMFAYLQHPETLILTGEDHSVLYWHKFDTLLDLGLVNLAEKNLTECMETFGAQPMILQRLAQANLVKGKIGSARIYLGALQKTLFFSHWAGDYLARLDADPTLARDPEIRQKRAHLLQKDSTAFFYVPEPMLRSLVAQGGQNRMAFEYLMAWYLLTKQLDKLVQNLPRLSEFGYTAIPSLYQEATLIYATRYPVPLGNFSISARTQQRIKGFSDIFNRYGRDKNAAWPELAREYAGSYFFYFIYAASPTRQ